MSLDAIGKTMLTIGLLLVFLGGLMVLFSKLGLGRLPGDIYMKRGNMTFYFPLATSIIVSLILTLILNFILRK